MPGFLVNKAALAKCVAICTVSSNSEFHHAPSRVGQINCNHKQQRQASMGDETLEMNVLMIISDITHTAHGLASCCKQHQYLAVYSVMQIQGKYTC
jgi:hypothetical protein